ncbi:hypothetical protein KCH_19690 [Kitasatospora cheerisanensis KCTC 2395]|uniref:Uncharacterized protein n=1 Tax=Kitasatospora cheerisanensis KCTC 2395 TaxID=1348663 RepID=A0A066YY56_9ACTN|nr:hypothetical protein KCH_19690 [Kitasatospora cheerisanensis KCTC 2395]
MGRRVALRVRQKAGCQGRSGPPDGPWMATRVDPARKIRA